jgi:thymidylate synthase (FAD)
MNIIKPSYEIMTEFSEGGIKELQFIEKIARKCYKSESLITEDGASAERMIADLIKKNHTAMIEHSIMTVVFIVDRGVSHELVRHRLASFAQESTRYCNYSKNKFGNKINVIDIDGGIQFDAKMQNLPEETIQEIIAEWILSMDDAERHYMRMVELGATPQIARGVLPNSLKTEIVVTANFREWRNIFNLRTEHFAHPQMREVMIPLLEEVKQKMPIVFDDIEVK